MSWINTITLLVAMVLILPACISEYAAATPKSTPGMLPEINVFQVNPGSMRSGETALLTWNIKGANSVLISQGIGDVASIGSTQVAPLYTTSYKISAVNETGIRERYITLVVDLPVSQGETVGSDPVTGRNAQIDLSWEDYCYSSHYQVQIARDPGFTLVVFDSGVMAPSESTSPAFWYPPGLLEAGHTYYWRVRIRQATTGQRILSPWSEAKPITVRPGFQVQTNYQGILALVPVNGCLGCPVKPVSFSWTGYPGTTKYRFLLARDSQLQNVVVEAFTTTTSYEYTGTLEYSKSYFWQVMAVEPIPSDKSAALTFYTEQAPLSATRPAPSSTAEPPLWAWIVIAVGAGLSVLVIVLLVQAGRK